MYGTKDTQNISREKQAIHHFATCLTQVTDFQF